MNPEFPFLAAGGVSLIGSAIAEKKWPSNALRSIIGTVALVVIASATSGTRIAPLVRATGFLILLVAVLAAGKQIQQAKPKK